MCLIRCNVNLEAEQVKKLDKISGLQRRSFHIREAVKDYLIKMQLEKITFGDFDNLINKYPFIIGHYQELIDFTANTSLFFAKIKFLTDKKPLTEKDVNDIKFEILLDKVKNYFLSLDISETKVLYDLRVMDEDFLETILYIYKNNKLPITENIEHIFKKYIL